MGASTYVGKLIGLIKTLNNPPFFMYRIFHYMNRFVPKAWATRIFVKNQKEYKIEGVKDYLLETYDGSGQAVHPDIAYLKNRYWLAITPYPYGMEEYENPCIYSGDTLKDLSTPEGPIAVQRKHTQGLHLSDPCFAIDGEQLYCYYRESERKGEIEENTVWEKRYNESDNTWGKSELIMDSVDDKILSPAMVYKNPGELTIYYVSSLNGSYSLVSTKSKGAITDITKHKIIGFPEDYELWHIGISKVRDINPETVDCFGLLGLFLAKAKSRKGDMKLFEARNNGLDAEWNIISEVKMPDNIKDIVAFPYKSCYIPHEKGKILLSFRDKRSRNRLIIV